MKTIKEYISEKLDNNIISNDILKNEISQSKFPKHFDIKDTDDDACNFSMNKTTKDELMSQIYGCVYGRLPEITSYPQCSMFNAFHVRLLQNQRIKDKLINNEIVLPIKSYTEDTDLGPQDIYYITKKGERWFNTINEDLEHVIVKVGNIWRIKGHPGKGTNTEKRGYWKAKYKTKEDAEKALKAYFANINR